MGRGVCTQSAQCEFKQKTFTPGSRVGFSLPVSKWKCVVFFPFFFFTGCLRFLSKGKSNYGYFDFVINGRLQCPEQQPQYDVLFLLKPNHPKCTPIHGDLLNRVHAFTIAVMHS